MVCSAILPLARRVLHVVVVVLGAVTSTYAGDVRLAWDPNSESDLAGYVVLIGTASGVYTQSLEVAPASPEAEIKSLPDGATYFFAVRAFNTAGLQSGLSNEVSVTLGTLPGPPPVPAPAITTVAPATGPTSGGTAVTISGSHFTTGLTVRFGSTLASVTSASASSIVAVAPAGVAGQVSVTVTNPDGQMATKAGAYTYTTTTTGPAITGFAPTSGPMGGGTLVTITGTQFTAGATVRFGAASAAVQSVSATSIVARTPAMPAGPAPVVVTLTTGQTVTATGTFTVLAPSPVISAVGPAWGSTAGGTLVTITGSQFMTGASVLFGAVPATVSSVASTMITAVAPARAAGVVGVTVVNPGGGLATKAGAFTYVGQAPVLGAVTPNRGPASGGNTVVVTGQHFAPGLVVTFDGVPSVVKAVTATSAEVIVPARPAGAAAVVVRNADGQSTSSAGAYTFDALAPTLSGVSPTRGPIDGGTLVTLSGTHFTAGATVSVGGLPAAVTAVTATAIVITTPVGAPGAADVTVRNPDGMTATLVGAFTYDAPEEPTPSFVRYFAEGVQGGFFDTRFAIANPHAEVVPVEVTFTDVFAQELTMTLEVPAGGRATVDRSNMPSLASEAFASKFESPRELGIDRTVAWDRGAPYGAHSETGLESPRTVWYFAEGATHSGFELFYLLQNPTDTAAEVLVRYMLGSGQVIERVHTVAARARTNVWVNHDDRALASAEVSAQLISLNGVPIVAERSMYQNVDGQLFTAGHNSGGIAEPSTRWFLAEGATGDYFDTFVLIANPNSTAATLLVTYMLPDGAPLEATYTVAPNSRFTIWADHEHPRLKKTDLSVVVASTNGVPVIVERTMWWPGAPGGRWTEAHNSAGATTTASAWVMADGFSSVRNGGSTYALVANTGGTRTLVRFTLLTTQGRGRVVEAWVGANSRFSMDVAQTFPEAQDTAFSLLVESGDGAPLVVERASYWSAGAVHWAAGTNSLASPLGQTRTGTAATH